MAEKVLIVKKPPETKNTMSIFSIPTSLKQRARIVCAKRNITYSKFIRESIEKNIENYNYLLKSL